MIRVNGLQQLRMQLERMDAEAIVRKALTQFVDIDLAASSLSVSNNESETKDFGEALRRIAVGRSARTRIRDAAQQVRGVEPARGEPLLPTRSSSGLAADPTSAERIAETVTRLLSGS